MNTTKKNSSRPSKKTAPSKKKARRLPKMETPTAGKRRGRPPRDPNSVWVVVTTVNDGERDLFSDVVLITRNKARANSMMTKLKKKKAKIDWLAPYDDAAYFTRTIDDESI